MKRTTCIGAVISLLLIIAAYAPIKAQNNIYKIDDRLFEIYDRADKMRSKSTSMAVFDTLKMEAVRLGDKKAECLAYVGQLNYILSVRDTLKFKKYSERLMEVSRRNGYLQYFYFAISSVCTTYLNMGMLEQASECIEELKKYTQADDYQYGYYVLYIQTAHLSMKQSDFSKAADLYLKAAHLCETSIPDQIPVGAYTNAAIALMTDERLPEALECAKMTRKYDESTTIKARLTTQSTICSLLFLMDRFDELKQEYELFEQILKESGEKPSSYPSPAPAILEAVKGNYNKSIELMKRSGNSFLYFQVMKKIYTMKGDYKMALIIADSIYETRVDNFRNFVAYNVAENQTQLENIRLSNERDRLELENRLSTRRSIMMLAFAIVLISAIFGIFYVRRMREAVKRLEKANAAKDVFVRNMSHEVRTPLNAVVGFSQMMAFPELLTEEQRQQFGRYITDNGAMLAMLIDDVLDSLDLDSERFRIHIKESNPDTMCRMAVESTREKTHGDVVMSFKSDVPADFTFNTDPLRVQQILQNLLNNACKNTESGTITLELKHDEKAGNVIFSVTDTGCGVPADKAEKIFERFVKLDAFKPGSGMGLAICREIAEKLNGTITLDPSYTTGARFILTVPA